MDILENFSALIDNLLLLIIAATREGGTGGNPGERTRVSGEQTDEKNWETGKGHCH